MDLKRRIEEFKEMEYEFNKDFYATIKEQQHPHTLFIACSDSRVDAETMFQAHAGEIFQIRNVANIVPREEEPDTHPSVVSAIEYAVIVLGVENLIVCGHSNCGGCAAIRNLEKYKEKLPYTAEWISQSITISDYIDYPVSYTHLPFNSISINSRLCLFSNSLIMDNPKSAYSINVVTTLAAGIIPARSSVVVNSSLPSKNG